MQVKYGNFFFLGYFLFIKVCWNCFCFFYNFITRNHWIIHNIYLILSIFATTWSSIPNIIFSYIRYFLHSHQHFLLFLHWSELNFFSSSLHLHSHDISFIKIFCFIFLFHLLETYIFKSSVLFGTDTLLD